jgi:hypothetical protein
MIAVIPAFNRFSLLRQTIKRLKIQSIVIGHQPEVEQICEETGSIFVYHSNDYLGAKWNAGFKVAKSIGDDSVLFLGSSDWLCDNWIDVCSQYLEDFDMIGKPDCHLLDINTKTGMRLVHWPGYLKGPRSQEPIGIGRVISARILDKFKWTPFDSHMNNSMDWQMYQRVLRNRGKIKLLTTDIHSMAISTNLWPNKHQFKEHWNNQLRSKKMYDVKGFLKQWFPDALTLKL